MARTTAFHDSRSERADWQAAKVDLRVFSAKRFINCWPGFERSLPPDARRSETEIAERVRRTIGEDDLRRHFESTDGRDLLRIPSRSRDGKSLWTCITLSAPGDESEDAAAALFKGIEERRRHLGLECLRICHPGILQIFFLYEESVPSAWASRLGWWLLNGLPDASDRLVFPYDPSPVASAAPCLVPLIGRLVDLDRWPAVLSDQAGILKGRRAIRQILATKTNSPALIPPDVRSFCPFG
ncbi:MAG TPA: hypothetical protein VF170_19720 [Planctomycetaceae bacterium]